MHFTGLGAAFTESHRESHLARPVGCADAHMARCSGRWKKPCIQGVSNEAETGVPRGQPAWVGGCGPVALSMIDDFARHRDPVATATVKTRSLPLSYWPPAKSAMILPQIKTP